MRNMLDCSYLFLKKYKEYTFIKNISHNACLFEICENVVLLSKGVSSIPTVKILADLHTIAEHY